MLQNQLKIYGRKLYSLAMAEDVTNKMKNNSKAVQSSSK